MRWTRRHEPDEAGAARAAHIRAESERSLAEATDTVITPFARMRDRNNVTALVAGLLRPAGGKEKPGAASG